MTSEKVGWSQNSHSTGNIRIGHPVKWLPWIEPSPPFEYSDIAIQALLTLKAVFDLPDRMVEGLAASIVRLLGLALRIPDHTLLSRRAKTLQVSISRRQRTGPVRLVVDSIGLKVYGEGEWKVRQYGAGRWRTWRKVHLAVGADAKDVIGVEVTTEEWTDGGRFAGLLDQIDGDLRAGGRGGCLQHPPRVRRGPGTRRAGGGAAAGQRRAVES